MMTMNWNQNTFSRSGGSLLDWYHKTSDVVLDTLCCCSYVNAQLGTEDGKTKTYYNSRPTDWFQEDDDYSYFPCGNKGNRDPPRSTGDCYSFDFEMTLKTCTSSSNETTTTIVLADSMESFENSEDHQEGSFVNEPSFSKHSYDKENDFMAEQEASFVNCGMPLYNFQVNNGDSTPKSSNRDRFKRKSNGRHQHQHASYLDNRDEEDVFVLHDSEQRQEMCRYSPDRVLREVQMMKGRAVLPLLSMTQGIEC